MNIDSFKNTMDLDLRLVLILLLKSIMKTRP